MEFSKKYLSKYGWEEGQGLGKTRSGIKTALKPKLKFDKAGIGFDHSREFTESWWDKLYNDALNKGDSVSKKDEKDSDNLEETNKNVDESQPKKKLEPISNSLFEACNRRTAHKGARHGLQLSGKLNRLEQQEKSLMTGEMKKREKTKKRKMCEMDTFSTSELVQEKVKNTKCLKDHSFTSDELSLVRTSHKKKKAKKKIWKNLST